MKKHCGKPNVILINCDDLGYGDPGCYGSVENKTPYIDKLAEDGIRLTDFYMASSVCTPSRAAMLTGCYPKRIDFCDFHGRIVLFPGDGKGLNPDEKTIASVLKDAGYAAKMVGKWHCGDQKGSLPTQFGFDEYYGLPYSNDMGRQVGKRIDFPPLPLLKDNDVLEEQPDLSALTERYLDQSIQFIRSNRENPFFLYLAHMYVHLPHYPLKRFADENPNPYAACVASVDWCTGVITAELERLGLEEDTLVIFTSDNGSRNDFGPSNGELRGTKRSSWEGGFRVPCIMKWPKAIPRGRVSGEICTSMDFLPTLARLCGGRVPDDRIIDGHDISDHLIGESDSTGESTFIYYYHDHIEAVRRGDWKLHIRREDAEVTELYNLRNDIGETENLYASHGDLVQSLMDVIRSFRRELGDAASGDPGIGCREALYTEDPVPLTRYNPDHPYYMAMYDLGDFG